MEELSPGREWLDTGSARASQDDGRFLFPSGSRHRFRHRLGVPVDGRQLPVVGSPFIVLTKIPGALAGILWILFLTPTT